MTVSFSTRYLLHGVS